MYRYNQSVKLYRMKGGIKGADVLMAVVHVHVDLDILQISTSTKYM